MRELVILLILIISLTLTPTANATLSYVLPYPSTMPGSIFYRLNLIKETVQRFWYFGDFGKFTYNLKISDKYLVEAKTLFEYKQYLLALSSLNKSDEHFRQTLKFINSAKKANKDIEKNRKLLSEAALKHIEVLGKLEGDLPESVVWSPEKSAPKNLLIKDAIENSKKIREKFL